MSDDRNVEIVMSNRSLPNANKMLSDDVIIAIVHAFKDIIIEFMNRKYPSKD